MEKKDQDLIKKVTKLVDESKRKKITDFDSGLLQESFEPVVGTTVEKYDLWCKRLLNIATRLENIRLEQNGSLDDEKYSILKEIDDVLSKKPSRIQVTRGEKGTIEIMCDKGDFGDALVKASGCTEQIFDKTLDAVREYEYFDLINSIKKLEYRARARIDQFRWHKSDAIEDVGSAKRM